MSTTRCPPAAAARIVAARMPRPCTSSGRRTLRGAWRRSACFLFLALAALGGAPRRAGAAAPGVRVADFSMPPDSDAACVGVCDEGCPCASLQAAMDAAVDGDEVWMVPPPGGAAIPCPDATTNKSLTVRGAPGAPSVEIDCAGSGRAMWFDARAAYAMATVRLVGLTFKNGAGDVGGCVRADDARLLVEACSFQGCASDRGGGALGLAVHRGDGNVSLIVARSSFRECHAGGSGGAIGAVMWSGSGSVDVHVLASTFLRTSAALGGGAVSIAHFDQGRSANVSVVGSTFADSTAHFGGGAVEVVPAGDLSQAAITISASRFERCSTGDRGGAVSVHATGSVAALITALQHCTFDHCSAGQEGGAVAVYMEGASAEAASTTVSTCSFARCSAGMGGGALAVLAPSRAPRAATAVTASRFQHLHAQSGGGALALRFSGPAAAAAARVSDSAFHNCSGGWHGGTAGAVTLEFAGDAPAAHVALARCNFTLSRGTTGGAAFVYFARNATDASVSVASSRFEHSVAQQHGGAVAVHAVGLAAHLVATFTACAFAHSRAGGSGGAVHVWLGGHEHAAGAAVTLERCGFSHSAAQWGGAVEVEVATACAGCSVRVTDGEFAHSRAESDGGALALSFRHTAAATAHIAHTRFMNGSAGHAGGCLYLAEGEGGAGAASDLRAAVTGSSFQGCRAGVQGGAVFAALSRQQEALPPTRCWPVAPWRQRAWRTSSSLAVQDSRFSACRAGVGGALDVAGGEVLLRGCAARGSAAASAGGFLHTSGSAAARVEGCTVEEAAAAVDAFVRHEGAGALVIKNTTFAALPRGGGDDSSVADSSGGGETSVLTAPAAAAPLVFADGSSLACAPGERFVTRSRNDDGAPSPSAELWSVYAACASPAVQGVVTTVAYDAAWACVPCPPATYFLSSGGIRDALAKEGTCRDCPFGATCLGRDAVRANAGMWGTTLSAVAALPGIAVTPAAATEPLLPPALLRCADGYCCGGGDTCARFDSCAPGRAGFLCGECAEGFTGVVGSARCRPRERCGSEAQDVLFWPVTLLGVLALTAWQVRAAAGRAAAAEAAAAEAAAAGPAAATAASDTAAATTSAPRAATAAAAERAGIAKAAFAYYQAFPLLLMSGNAVEPGPAQALLLQLFNLRAADMSAGGAGVCPFPGLTPVASELVSIVVVLAVLCALPVVHLGHTLVAWFGCGCDCRRLPCLPRHLQPPPPPRLHAYAGALTSLVMLTYSTLTTAVLRLLTCVEVPGHGQRLLIQGSVACWSEWWQWAALMWCVASTLCVPAALAYGGRLLRMGAISPAAFWLALFLPLPCMLAWACTLQHRHAYFARRDKPSAALLRVRAATLAAFDSGYRDGLWWWDAVLLLRRLLLSLLPLLLHQQPVAQALSAAIIVCACFVAHARVRPFRTQRGNDVEMGFLVALQLAALLAIRSATLLSVAAADDVAWRNNVASITLALLLLAFPLAGAVVAARVAVATLLRRRAAKAAAVRRAAAAAVKRAAAVEREGHAEGGSSTQRLASGAVELMPRRTSNPLMRV